MWEVASGARAWHHTFSRSARRQYWRQALQLKAGASLCLLAPISPNTEPEICVLISTGFSYCLLDPTSRLIFFSHFSKTHMCSTYGHNPLGIHAPSTRLNAPCNKGYIRDVEFTKPWKRVFSKTRGVPSTRANPSRLGFRAVHLDN